MSNIDLDALRAQWDADERVIKAATPGPWHQDCHYVVGEVPDGRPGGEVIIACSPTVQRLDTYTRSMRQNNAAFVVHARHRSPALVVTARALANEVERLQALEAMIDGSGDYVQCPECRYWLDANGDAYTEGLSSVDGDFIACPKCKDEKFELCERCHSAGSEMPWHLKGQPGGCEGE